MTDSRAGLVRPRKQRSIHGSCTVDENGYCDECGEYWPESDERRAALSDAPDATQSDTLVPKSSPGNSGNRP